jgi:hypothetical protein
MFTKDYEILPGRVLSAVGAVLILAGLVGCPVANSWKYSEGTRVGMVNKISQKGAIWKTHEGQMALEGIVSEPHLLCKNGEQCPG